MVPGWSNLTEKKTDNILSCNQHFKIESDPQQKIELLRILVGNLFQCVTFLSPKFTLCSFTHVPYSFLSDDMTGLNWHYGWGRGACSNGNHWLATTQQSEANCPIQPRTVIWENQNGNLKKKNCPIQPRTVIWENQNGNFKKLLPNTTSY